MDEKCSSDWHKLAMNKAWMDDYTACETACMNNFAAVGNNFRAGTNTLSCNTTAACTKFKKTCAAEAGWGWWVEHSVTVTINLRGGSFLKDSTHTLGFLKCYPSSCEGMEMPSHEAGGSMYDIKTYEIKAGTTTTNSKLGAGMTGITGTETIAIEQMPPPMWFYIVIVVGVVLLIALTVWRCGKPAAGQHLTVLQQMRLGNGR